MFIDETGVECKFINDADGCNKCPNCNNSNIIKHGNYSGKQRFKCKNCEKTFSIATNTPNYYSKKNSEVWRRFSKMLFEGITLRECALELNISLSTAFFWRHKLLNAIKDIEDVNYLAGCINIQKRFIKESFKGQKGASVFIKERMKLWLFFAGNSDSMSIAKPVSREHWDKERFDKLIYTKIDKKAYVSSSGDRYVKNIIEKRDKKIDIQDDSISKNFISNMCFQLGEIIDRSKGVASKYLENYIVLAKIYSSLKDITISSVLNKILLYDSFRTYEEVKSVEIIIG